ncbi:MAG: hypothetical protein H0U25_05305 [Thermoleophilaceae bacterium]|nr:hypothetical protein [Thermoleophilaceae bacterium]
MSRLTFLRGRELVNVAGESHYQEALRELTGTGGSEAVRIEAGQPWCPSPATRTTPTR